MEMTALRRSQEPAENGKVFKNRLTSFALIGLLSLVSLPSAFAQTFASEVTVRVDPGQFGLEKLSPAPSATGSGQVFAGGVNGYQNITIRQFVGGTIQVLAPSRTEVYNLQNGSTYTNSYGAELKGSIGPEAANFGGSTVISNQSSSSTTTTSDVKNSLNYKLDGNVVSAVVEYTEGGVKYADTITLGYVTPDGGFKAFTDGWLAGKQVINGMSSNHTDDNNAPATYGGQRGNVKSGASAVYASVIVGYWVTVTTVGGNVVNVSVDPQYGTRLVGFQSYVPQEPGGGNHYQN